MSHGSIGDPAHGLSKSISMGLVLIVCPSKEDEPMSFKEAWHACNMDNLQPLHLKLLGHLDTAVTQHFWVRNIGFWVWSRFGLG